jgi:hypothetical protein
MIFGRPVADQQPSRRREAGSGRRDEGHLTGAAVRTWTAHLRINQVMLATALIPDAYLGSHQNRITTARLSGVYER